MDDQINDKFEIKEVKVKLVSNSKNPNFLANASLTFKGNDISYFTISGFTVWESNYGGLNVEVPRNNTFRFCLFEESLWKKIKKIVIKKYELEKIPVIEEDEDSEKPLL